MRKFILLLSVILLLFCAAGYAQSLADIQAPKIISPPPEAAELGKYGQVPVDKSTGIPDISVPIYEIKTPRFSLPISLSYHASGIKVSEMSTWVGAGWSLNAGGVITRTIIGLADDGPGGLLSSTTPLSTQMNTFGQTPNTISYNTGTQPFDNACTQVDEYQPDNFFYNFAGNSGAFVFGPDAARTPVLTPYKPLKITYTQPSIGVTGTFTVLDEAGNSYYFNNTEFASNSNYQSSYADSWYLTQMISADKSDTLTFQYQVDAVMSAQVYPTYTQTYSYIPNKSFGDFVGGTGCPVAPQTGQIVSSVNITDFYKPLYIKTILYKGGRVDFVAKGGRLEGTQNFYGPHLSLDSIIVSNYDYNQKTYTRLKSFKMYTGYWNNPLALYPLTNPPIYTGSYYRLRLDSMAENDQNNIVIKTHKFDYDPVALPPINYYAQDYWGYYNGQVQNPTLLQQQQSVDLNGNTYVAGNANRNINATYMKAGMLEQITYPTKGYTVFSYEPHQYLKYNSVNLPQRTASTSSVGYHQETNTTTFTTDVKPGGGTYKGVITYTLNEISGISTGAPTVELIYTANNSIVWQQADNSNSYTTGTIAVTLYPGEQYELYASSPGGSQSSQSLPVAGISVNYQVNLADSAAAMASGGGLRIRTIQNFDANGSTISTERYKYGSTENGAGVLMNDTLAFADTVNRVYWSLINTTIQDGVYGNYYQQTCSGLDKTFSSNPVYALSTLSGSPVAYGAVTIYHGDTINNIGKSRYEYMSYPDSVLQTSTSYQNGTMLIPVGWKNGQLIHEAQYRNSGNGLYALEQEKYTNYNNMPRTSAMGIYVGYRFETNGFNNPAWPQPNTFSIIEPEPTYENLQKFLYFSYPISTGTAVPTQTTTINYATDGVTVLTQDTTHFYYDNHTHMYPTRIVSYDGKGDSTLKQVQYPQDMMNTPGLDPNGTYAAMSAKNIISPVIQFTQSKQGKQVPVLEQLMQSITNYSATNGNYNPQTVSLQVLNNPAEIRLNYQKYDNNGNLLTVSKQNGDPVSYIWGYDCAFPVAEVKNAQANDIFFESFEDGNGNTADAKTGRYSHIGIYNHPLTGLDAGNYLLTYWQKGGSVWTLVTTQVTVSGSTYTINLNAQVDDIRFFPANALMTTYTYDPLIGVTSTTDAKGLINYYEYDSFQRLVNIRDQYNNIVKSYCYNYAGQVGSCFIDLPSFKSAAINQTFTRNNCSTGYGGNAVTYSLAAGSYVSNISQDVADSLAQADANAYGQAYANANGVCLQDIAFTMTNNTTSGSQTGVAVGMQITFSGPTNLTFTMPSSGSQIIQIPTGTYSVSVGPDNNYHPHHIQLGSGTPVYNPSTQFTGVNIATGSSTLTLTISN